MSLVLIAQSTTQPILHRFERSGLLDEHPSPNLLVAATLQEGGRMIGSEGLQANVRSNECDRF